MLRQVLGALKESCDQVEQRAIHSNDFHFATSFACDVWSTLAMWLRQTRPLSCLRCGPHGSTPRGALLYWESNVYAGRERHAQCSAISELSYSRLAHRAMTLSEDGDPPADSVTNPNLVGQVSMRWSSLIRSAAQHVDSTAILEKAHCFVRG
jgi:hypothetical protein